MVDNPASPEDAPLLTRLALEGLATWSSGQAVDIEMALVFQWVDG
jgi:hypothetical protein